MSVLQCLLTLTKHILVSHWWNMVFQKALHVLKPLCLPADQLLTFSTIKTINLRRPEATQTPGWDPLLSEMLILSKPYKQALWKPHWSLSLPPPSLSCFFKGRLFHQLWEWFTLSPQLANENEICCIFFLTHLVPAFLPWVIVPVGLGRCLPPLLALGFIHFVFNYFRLDSCLLLLFIFWGSAPWIFPRWDARTSLSNRQPFYLWLLSGK